MWWACFLIQPDIFNDALFAVEGLCSAIWGHRFTFCSETTGNELSLRSSETLRFCKGKGLNCYTGPLWMQKQIWQKFWCKISLSMTTMCRPTTSCGQTPDNAHPQSNTAARAVIQRNNTNWGWARALVVICNFHWTDIIICLVFMRLATCKHIFLEIGS